MPSTSPLSGSDGYLNFVINVGGNQIQDKLQVVEITTCARVNNIPTAKIVLIDGDMPSGKFEISDSDDFKPGQEISISAGYGAEASVIFSGVVYRQCVDINTDVHAQLIVHCCDKSLAMTVNRQNAIYQKQTDSDIMASVIGNTAGLTNDIKSTSVKYTQLVQFNATDWDFLVMRAQFNGYIITIDQAKVTVQPPDLSTSPELGVTWGNDLIDFHAELDARYQFAKVQACAWGIADQKIVKKSAEPSAGNAQGNSSEQDLAKVLGVKQYNLETSADIAADALDAWAKSRQQQSALARIRGHMRFTGNAKAKIGSQIKISGVGQRFEGNVFVTQVEHILQKNQWISRVEFGLSPHFYSEFIASSAPAAAGVAPGVDGMQIGVVQKLADDPDKLDRILVQIPVCENTADGIWARLASPYASKEVGHFFIPEVGDEVIVAYINNDPSQAVIVGSLYSSKLSPPYKIDKDNNTKAIVSKSKLKIEFDDKNSVTTLTTPNKNQFILSDKDKAITLEDQNNNQVKLSEDGIVLKSAKNIEINTEKDLKLTGNNITLKAKNALKEQAMSIQSKADQMIEAKASAALKLSASGNTTVKGAVVNINPP